MVGQHPAQGLDTPAQPAGWLVVLVLADELDHHLPGRSSSAAKKLEAALRISFARRNSAFSLFSALSCSDSAVVTPGRAPASTSARRTHFRSVSADPIPSLPAIERMASNS